MSDAIIRVVYNQGDKYKKDDKPRRHAGAYQAYDN